MDTNPAMEVAETSADESTVDERLARIFDAPEPEEEAPEEDKPEATEEDAQEPEAEAKEADEDTEEVEFDGEKYALPKKLKEAFLRQQDYTVKTQEAAAVRKAAEDKAQFLEAREQLMAAVHEETAELRSLQKQHEQYEALNWEQLYNADPGQALRLRDQRDDIARKIEATKVALNTKAQTSEQMRSMHLAKQIELGRAELIRRVGAITDTDRQGVAQQAAAMGFTEEELGRITDPRLMHALVELTRLKAKAQAGQQIAQKKVAAAKPIKPVARTAPQTQRDSSMALAREKLRKTGRGEYAERIFNQMFKD